MLAGNHGKGKNRLSAQWGEGLSLSKQAARDKEPETMNLKERFAEEGNMPPVIFTHRHHQELLKCKECHLDPEGGGRLRFEIRRKISVQRLPHKACWPCHRKMNVAGGTTNCGTCHGRQPGR
jgi:hypothetical protein